ncbi:MAG: hypothetical protein ACLP5H_27110 [Desulfomonilaceae bacterium]
MEIVAVRRLGAPIATLGNVRDQPKVADAPSELLQDSLRQIREGKVEKDPMPPGFPNRAGDDL